MAKQHLLVKRRALRMSSMSAGMLCVLPSLARKSSACGNLTAVLVLGPSEITAEKPTPLRAAQSRIDEVSAPDCDTSASGPAAAIAPPALAFSFRCARWKPRLLGAPAGGRRGAWRWGGAAAVRAVEVFIGQEQQVSPWAGRGWPCPESIACLERAVFAQFVHIRCHALALALQKIGHRT